MSESENNALNRSVRKTGLTKSAYIRTLITGYVPKKIPGEAFYTLIHTLDAIHNSMNLIAAKASAISQTEAASYYENAHTILKITQRIYEAVMLPERMKPMDKKVNI